MFTPLWLKSPEIFGGGGHGVNHGVGLDVAQAFVVHEEEGLARMPDRAAERSAKVVLHQEISRAHLVEGVGVHVAVAQEFVGGAVKVGWSRSG